MLVCSSCHTPNNYYHKYCYNCGAKLDVPEELLEAEDPIVSTDDSSSTDNDVYFTTLEPLPAKKATKSKLIPILLSVVGVLSIAGIFLLISLFNTSPHPAVDQKQATSITPSSKVEALEWEGQPAHKFTFYGPEGAIIRFEGKELVIKNGQAETTLQDITWENKLAESESSTLKLTASIIQNDQVKNIDLPPFEVQLPKTSFLVMEPSSLQAETTLAVYPLKLKPQDGATVTCNGTEITTPPDSDGIVTIEVPLEKEGENTFVVAAQAKGFLKNERKVVIVKKAMDIPIEITNESPYRSESSTYTIEGITEPGAEITANVEVEGNAKVDADTGKFTIKVVLPNTMGDNQVILTARKNGKGDSSILLHIERVLSDNEYLAQAATLDYDTLAANPEEHKGKVLTFTGTVTQITQQEKPVCFLLDVGGESPQILAVEYIGDTAVQEGKKLQVVGEITGTQDGHPKLLARLGYKIRQTN